ncbi:sugar O-acetyltransferase [Demequina activiva]|uniref:Acetyltransferase n=1 Tax=Demequina activiva TaxID=1582364 RepID=A0A919Q4N7_9MICO|nr:sugar O-acetyltransferase [Demequina activiva]GIG54228.1 hypothetical protein Dac01nite_09800 [Demequina activiva]
MRLELEQVVRRVRDHTDGEDDLRRLVDGEWVQYRLSRSLLDHTSHAHTLCERISRALDEDAAEATRLLRELVPGLGDGVDVRPPFSIDYGLTLTVGDRTFINADLLIIGGGPVVIGEDCLIGPRCGIYTPNHAEDPVRRREGFERAAPVVIEDNVWLGGSVTITPGVTIGRDSIVGAGSVVTRDVPPGVVAAGNPCRVLRDLVTQA